MSANTSQDISQRTILAGVILTPLESHHCARGSTTELYRHANYENLDLPQWNLIESVANSLRGMQVHLHRIDYLCVAGGEVLAGLHDLRPDSPTYGHSSMLRFTATERQVLIIPTGIAHGFYFPVDTLYIQGLSVPWTGEDDFRCVWNDPALDLDWPVSEPIISDLDRSAGSLMEVRNILHQRWGASDKHQG